MSLMVPRGWSGNETRADEFNSSQGLVWDETRADEFNSPALFPVVGLGMRLGYQAAYQLDGTISQIYHPIEQEERG